MSKQYKDDKHHNELLVSLEYAEYNSMSSEYQ